MCEVSQQGSRYASCNAFRPGVVCKNNKLLEFTRHSLTVMRPWPKPLAWRRTTRKPFRPVRPKTVLVPTTDDQIYPDDTIAARVRQALQTFMAPVPADARDEIARFSERQWHMMALFARCPGALDLVKSTPALAFALASNWVFTPKAVTQPLRSARALLCKRQVQICDWLGFPARPSTIHLLRKLRIDNVSIQTLLYFRDALWNEDAVRLLRHCPSISATAVMIATRPGLHNRFSHRFLLDLAKHEGASNQNEFSSVIDWATRPGIFKDNPNRVFDSLTQLLNFQQSCYARGRNSEVCSPELELPLPPVAGTPNIVPLRTGQDLLAEASAMRNCVATLCDSAADGTMAFYRITAPERATLSLIRDDGIWRVCELRGPGNARVSQNAYAAVYAWLGLCLRGFPDGSKETGTVKA